MMHWLSYSISEFLHQLLILIGQVAAVDPVRAKSASTGACKICETHMVSPKLQTILKVTRGVKVDIRQQKIR